MLEMLAGEDKVGAKTDVDSAHESFAWVAGHGQGAFEIADAKLAMWWNCGGEKEDGEQGGWNESIVQDLELEGWCFGKSESGNKL